MVPILQSGSYKPQKSLGQGQGPGSTASDVDPGLGWPQGYGGEEKVYIATQGPIVSTIADFWRMVWQEHTPIIVMITNIEEMNEVGTPLCQVSAALCPTPSILISY